jgi:putative ATPase
MAINQALEEVKQSGDLPVPLHLRNAPTSLMKEMGYGADYNYAHDYPGHFVQQQYLPDALRDHTFWHHADNSAEERTAELQRRRWPDRQN